MEVRSVAPFLDYWDKVRGRTRRVVDRIPPDRLGRKRTPRVAIGPVAPRSSGPVSWPTRKLAGCVSADPPGRLRR